MTDQMFLLLVFIWRQWSSPVSFHLPLFGWWSQSDSTKWPLATRDVCIAFSADVNGLRVTFYEAHYKYRFVSIYYLSKYHEIVELHTLKAKHESSDSVSLILRCWLMLVSQFWLMNTSNCITLDYANHRDSIKLVSLSQLTHPGWSGFFFNRCWVTKTHLLELNSLAVCDSWRWVNHNFRECYADVSLCDIPREQELGINLQITWSCFFI